MSSGARVSLSRDELPTTKRGTGMDSWPKGIFAVTLFVEDLDAAKRFYGEVFGLPVVFEDDNSAVFDFGNTIINLLKATEAPGLIDPAALAPTAPPPPPPSTI